MPPWWPSGHRVANDLCPRGTGVALSSRGAQGLIDSTAPDLQRWQATRQTQEAMAVAHALPGDGVADLRGEVAMAGVMAHIDGRWQEAKGAPSSRVGSKRRQRRRPSAPSWPAAISVCWALRKL